MSATRTKAAVEMPLATGLPGGAPADADDLRYEFSPDVVMLADGREEEVEAIRTVRTHVMARHIRDGRRGLAVCAASAGVGCSFTAVNLAVSLAQVGVATLLIDGDLRAPRLDTLIRPQAPATGLVQCLSSGAPPSSFIHPDVIPNLSLLYAGGVAPNAQEVLASDGFKLLIERCLRDFEFTIVDTPAANACADARRVGTIIGYTLIVARTNSSRMAELTDLVSQLGEDGVHVIGAVLNDI